MAQMLLEEGSMWRDRFSQLSLQARDAARSPNPELARARIDGLISALGSHVCAQYSEGLDLHHFCRRVIHHDLPWNPAKLEQRTGRVDRVGSLSERLSQLEPRVDSEIDVWLPYVPGTYDEFIHDRVMARRREFRCILGNKPEWQQESLGENENGSAIDESLVQRLQVNLSPG